MSGGSRCDAEDSEVGIGSGVLEAVGRVYRRSSAAVTSAVLGAPPGLAESAGEHGHGDLRSHQQEKRWSFLSRRESRRIEEEGRGSRGEQRVGLVEGTSACAGEAEVFDCRAHSKTRLQHGLHGGDGGGGGGDADDGGRDLRNGQQCCAQGPLQSRNLKDTTQSTWAASGPRSGRDETRRRGVHEVRKITHFELNLRVVELRKFARGHMVRREPSAHSPNKRKRTFSGFARNARFDILTSTSTRFPCVGVAPGCPRETNSRLFSPVAFGRGRQTGAGGEHSISASYVPQVFATVSEVHEVRFISLYPVYMSTRAAGMFGVGVRSTKASLRTTWLCTHLPL